MELGPSLRRAAPSLVGTFAALSALFGYSAYPSEEAAEVPSDRAAIHFVEYGGIENWRADNDEELLIEARNGRWYRATFYGPCTGLRSATGIGFVSDAGGSVDRFSSIVVRQPGRRILECHFHTFEEVPPPPPPRKLTPAEPAPGRR